MGMSTHVVGFKPPGAKWRQMKAVWDACQAAGIEVPDEVDVYFDGGPPDPAGVEVGIEDLRAAGALRDWGNNHADGFELDVAKLPKDVTVVRFYNSW
jgi:hypothetical protein